ncbi:MAG TPA: prephenate dehydrogenase/arogenate dehydrogenase family protein [Patescibacteria group bacterium]|nr:prephenate dehydrogenase/arogenate dehydrogenase family protein [Patescibacteria group bacterium]
MHIAFLGLGLIGGSVARAAGGSGFATRVTAWTPDGRGPRAARAEGIEAASSAGQAIRGADLIVLAAPPLACLALLDDLAGPLARDLAPDAVVTDVASTKVVIVERARSLGLRFVGGHPMAGNESSGYPAADPALFRDRPWVLVPAEPDDAAADDRVAGLAMACGARGFQMSAAAHDAAVAAVSHVPLVLSAALVEAMTGRPDWPAASFLAAGGWASMSRLARGDPAMGAGIVVTNGPAIADRLRDLKAVVEGWLALLEAGAIDRVEVERRLAGVRGRAGDTGTPE